jgi:hypothetical protein
MRLQEPDGVFTQLPKMQHACQLFGAQLTCEHDWPGWGSPSTSLQACVDNSRH